MANIVQFKVVDKSIWAPSKAESTTFYRVVDTSNNTFELFLGGELLSNQAELEAALDRLDIVEGKVEALQTLTDGFGDSTIKDYIDTEISEAIAGVSAGQLAADIKANADAISAINDKDTGILAQAKKHTDDSISGLVTDVVTPLAGQVAALEETVGDAEGGLVKDVADLQETVGEHTTDLGTLKTSVATLIGSDANKSAREIATEQIDALIKAADPENGAVLENIQALVSYVDENAGDIAQLVHDVDVAEEAIANITSGATVVAKAEDATTLNGKSVDYFAVAETVNSALDLKANAAEVYTKGETDELLNDKANADDVYTKGEAEEKFVETVELVTGTANGTIKVKVDGSESAEVAVAGLGSAAFTDSTAYATSAQGEKADSAVQKADIVEGNAQGAISVQGETVKVHGLGTAAFANTEAFDAAGSASAVIGTASDSVDDATVYGAKAYAKHIAIDASGSALNLAKQDAAAQIETALTWTTLSSM